MGIEKKDIVFPSNPADQKIISEALGLMVESLIRQQSEGDLRKEIVSEIKEKYDIPPAMVNKWAKAAYDLPAKSEADATYEITETGFQLFVVNNARLSGSGAGITMEQVQERKEEREMDERRDIKEKQDAVMLEEYDTPDSSFALGDDNPAISVTPAPDPDDLFADM